MNSEEKKTSTTRIEDHRPIINLKHLNNFVLYKHFKMDKIEGLNSLKNLLQKGNYMCKLDQKDAYFSVPLHIDSRKLFEYCGKEICTNFYALALALVQLQEYLQK